MRTKPVSGPEFVRYFGPVLEALQELGGSGRPPEVRNAIAQKLGVSDQKRAELLASGNPRYDNQIHWARFYLAKAGYLDASKRGVWTLTHKGQAASAMTPDDALTIFKQVRVTLLDEQSDVQGNGALPLLEEESMAPSGEAQPKPTSYRAVLLDILKGLSPDGFERLCQRLLREAGFQQVIVTGRSGDGGIDGHGILQVNALVSFKVLFQCKRYAGSVSASQVRDFRGAMMGRADKGIILTTGTFSSDAEKEALRDGVPAIELVDSEKLLDMFENLELGLVPRRTYDVDQRFFDEFRSKSP